MRRSALILLLASIVGIFTLNAWKVADSDETAVKRIHPAAETPEERLDPSGIQDDMPASVDEVITWNFRVEYGTGCEATLVFEVEQRDGWHIYSQELPEGAVNFPTTFNFAPSDSYELVGDTWESETELRDNQGIMERFFKTHTAKFRQKIKIKNKNAFTVKANYDFMACKTSCFAPEFREYAFNVKGCSQAGQAIEEPEDGEEPMDEEAESTDSLDAADENDSVAVQTESQVGWKFYAIKTGASTYELKAEPVLKDGWRILDANDERVSVEWKDGTHFETEGEMMRPDQENYTVEGVGELNVLSEGGIFVQEITLSDTSKKIIEGTIRFSAVNDEGVVQFSEEEVFSIDLSKARDQHEVSKTKGSYWSIFLIAFGSGLLALLTPCVFPMIPLTVSFFTKSSTDRKKGITSGIMYGGSILAIYVLLSVPFHLLDSLNPNILNEISTNVPLNIFFFLMLFIFGLSFLGAFEITLPSKWSNKIDNASNVGGFVGTFLMALTLALVSFSCTGPILGSLLAGAGSGGAWALTVGMAGFGLALGLPFGLFAVFPGWLNTLPKSGGWLNQVKVVLGLLEIAFAFKFLSQADMVVQAHLLERELFIAIWIGVFLAMSLYLFGLWRSAHDSEPKKGLNTFRIVMGIITLSFTFYLLPGLWGAPLNLIGAFPPPESYSEIPYGIKGSAPEVEVDQEDFECEGAEPGVHGLMLFHDYEDALLCARERNVPLMLDFTGYACVNCRLMEQNVWSDEEVLKILSKDVVIASLYVDSREDLHEPETADDGEEFTTYGDKWSHLQKTRYFSSAQPQYVLIDGSEQMLNGDANYERHGNPDDFKAWLEEGLEEFEKVKNIKVYHFPVTEMLASEKF